MAKAKKKLGRGSKQDRAGSHYEVRHTARLAALVKKRSGSRKRVVKALKGRKR